MFQIMAYNWNLKRPMTFWSNVEELYLLSKISGVMLESLNFIQNCHVDSKKHKLDIYVFILILYNYLTI
jgi:hypothetical protein